ncbi:MAG: prepilin-type N-terminal cleavage/methylation domain-containing protein [Acidobacteriota bacterium]
MIRNLRRNDEHGFTLIEAVMGLSLLLVGMLAMAPLFVSALGATAGGADLGSVGALAVQRMEDLRRQSFLSLSAGGSLETDVTGFSDTSDPDFTIRWQIINGNPATSKTIRVRVTAAREVAGLSKQVTLTTVRAQ